MEEWDECGFGCWIARLRETRRVVGYVGLSVPMFLPEILPAVEVGWRFDPAHWGRGFASEGARAGLRGVHDARAVGDLLAAPVDQSGVVPGVRTHRDDLRAD